MPSANIIFLNAHIFTADSTHPTAQALAVQGNRILAVSDNAEIAAYRGPHTRVVDAAGRTLMPGLIDAHFHLLMGSLNLDNIQFEGVRDYAQMAQMITAYAAENPSRPWLEGYGLPYNIGPNATPLTRQHLDAIVADRPLIVFAYDYHSAWANTLALKLAGIFNGGACGPNSEIVLDEHGEATGALYEKGAFTLVTRLLPIPTAARKRALLHQGMRLAAQLGVTSVHNMDDAENEFYAAAEDAGELTLRLYLPYSVTPRTSVEQLRAEAPALRAKYQSDLLRGGSVKLFVDGVLESHTALLVEEYADKPGVFGEANYEREHFNQLIREADRLGFQVKVHACGDMGVRWSLDAYELAQRTNGVRDSRHRVEHIELIHPNDLHRFNTLGVIASMQPLHAPTAPETDVWASRAGAHRWAQAFAWQTLRAAGARLAFGSDWPIVSQDALLGVHHAVNRQPWARGLPHQAQTLEHALLAYTRDAAYAEFQEHQKGQLKPGYLADLVLLSADLFTTPLENLRTVRPVMTICDGRIVYEA